MHVILVLFVPSDLYMTAGLRSISEYSRKTLFQKDFSIQKECCFCRATEMTFRKRLHFGKLMFTVYIEHGSLIFFYHILSASQI